MKKPDSISIKLYTALQTAVNAKIILLTGTPIINYPNELAIAMNMIRGKIKTWSFKLSINTDRVVDENLLLTILKSDLTFNNIFDYLQYQPNLQVLTITRNPFGFYSTIDKESDTYKGVKLGEDGNIDDETFVKIITNILADNSITIVPLATDVEEYTCLPDTLDAFSKEFIETSSGAPKIINSEVLKSRILGLVSYFPDIDELLPKYDKNLDFKIMRIDMSDTQFEIYEEARVDERKIEKNNAKNRAKNIQKGIGQGGKAGEIYDDAASTYRIFSRAFCNFVFPRPHIHRPLPTNINKDGNIIGQTVNEDLLDALSVEEKLKNDEGKYDEDELIKFEDTLNKSPKNEEEKKIDENYESYETNIKKAIALLDTT